MREEKKKMMIDVSKGKSKVSYLNMFKPPKPLAVQTLANSPARILEKSKDTSILKEDPSGMHNA